MSALSGDHTGCSVLLYDTEGNHLINTKVIYHDKKALHVMLQEYPPSLEAGDSCRLLILTTPSPCEYMGRFIKIDLQPMIALYRGAEKEQRGATRYQVNSQALIENMIFDRKAYPLFAPLKVILINISKSGVRFRAPNYAMLDGDKFQMRMKIGEGDKLLIAEAVDHIDKDDGTSEYGCKFLAGKERAM